MPDWQSILSQEGPAAWRTAYRLLGNRADADECFQETCLAALAVSRREAVHNWRGLFLRLATSRAIDKLRARKQIGTQEPLAGCEQLRDGSPSPVQGAEGAELAAELRQALGRLPARQAEVFCLHCLEDWRYEEIGRHLGISTDSVGVLLYRARTRLRELLAAFDDRGRASHAAAPGPGPCRSPRSRIGDDPS